MKKFLIILLITLCFSVKTNAMQMIISCENDYIGKTVNPDGNWINDNIAGGSEWFYVDTETLPEATMKWKQGNDNKGNVRMIATWDESSIRFITFINSMGTILYQYYPRHNKMFKAKINNPYGKYPYAAIHYTTCRHNIK